MASIKKLTHLVREHLENDEEIQHTISGQYETKILGQDSVRGGILLATNKRLVFFAKKITGFDLEIFPYSNISSIEMSKGIMGYRMSFFASGNKVRMKWIKEVDKGDVQRFVEYVKGNIGKKASDKNLSLDLTDQIKKIAELREQGILSENEFQSKKTELLSKL